MGAGGHPGRTSRLYFGVIGNREGIEELVDRLQLNVETARGSACACAGSDPTSLARAGLFVGLIRINRQERRTGGGRLRLAVRALGKLQVGSMLKTFSTSFSKNSALAQECRVPDFASLKWRRPQIKLYIDKTWAAKFDE